MACKELAAKLAKEGTNSFIPNPVAFGLGLTDTAGPIAYFTNLAAGMWSFKIGRKRG